jgi:hypothetical protein
MRNPVRFSDLKRLLKNHPVYGSAGAEPSNSPESDTSLEGAGPPAPFFNSL